MLYEVSLLNTHGGEHMALGFSKDTRTYYLLYLGLLKTETPNPCFLKDSSQLYPELGFSPPSRGTSALGTKAPYI